MNFQRRSQLGQTLIETMIGIFTLIMGISAAVGLAVYSLSSTANVTQQMVAIGLAREGVEAARNMRDTNWLKDSLSVNGCYNYETAQNNQANCYKAWDNKFYDIKGTPSDKIFSFDYNSSAADSAAYWDLKVTGNSNNFGLNFNAAAPNGKFFSAANAANGNSQFYRKIIITRQTDATYKNPDFVRLRVQSLVWWNGKRCPVSTDYPTSGSCRVRLVTYLTNWKNY